MFILATMWLYSYLNLESTKTDPVLFEIVIRLYSYLNLESTKTRSCPNCARSMLYSYLNLESTKTLVKKLRRLLGCTVT